MQGAGSVHHIAWRTPTDHEQLKWLPDIQKAGLHVSPVMDRTYFHSIYYREPSGILFEIATDPPGFTVDEPLAQLGSTLVLPSWLEANRDKLLKILPPLRVEQVQHA
jgi:glyoxalase family protein